MWTTCGCGSSDLKPHDDIEIYGVYAVLALFIGIAIWRALQRRALRIARRTASDGAADRSLARSGDREIDRAMRAHLANGEKIAYQAIGYGKVRSWALGAARTVAEIRKPRHLIAVTDCRLLVLTTRLGLFGAYRGTPIFQAVELEHIPRIDARNEVLRFTFQEGPPLEIEVPFYVAGYSLANQRAFLIHVPRLRDAR
jgi:hypothetical protein